MWWDVQEKDAGQFINGGNRAVTTVLKDFHLDKKTVPRRLGQILAETPMNTGTKGQLKGSGSGGAKVEPPEDLTPTLEDMGIDKKLSTRS